MDEIDEMYNGMVCCRRCGKFITGQLIHKCKDIGLVDVGDADG